MQKYNHWKSLEFLEIKYYKLMVFPKNSYGLLFYEENEYIYYIFNFKEDISFYIITKNRFVVKK